MPWNKHLTQLNDALAILMPFREDVLPILIKAGINVAQIRFDSKPSNLWFSIIDHAESNAKLGVLIEVLLKDNPNNGYLNSFKDNYLYDLGVNINDVNWHQTQPAKEFEKILGKTSTLLPIYFLAEGLKASKCVVRIKVSTADGNSLGTGFLINNNYIVTNNHVIENQNAAAGALVQFNYEEVEPGSTLKSIDYKLNPAAGFFTSIKDDWTIVKLEGDANSIFRFLELKEININIGEFVTIIQHPGGGFKQIGLYRNIVTYIDENVIQYLTDTEPGSSGSPVFNSNWEVVGLHNSSGAAREPLATGSLLRNQGININKIMQAITVNKILV